jgi:hypothetical protein
MKMFRKKNKDEIDKGLEEVKKSNKGKKEKPGRSFAMCYSMRPPREYLDISDEEAEKLSQEVDEITKKTLGEYDRLWEEGEAERKAEMERKNDKS